MVVAAVAVTSDVEAVVRALDSASVWLKDDASVVDTLFEKALAAIETEDWRTLAEVSVAIAPKLLALLAEAKRSGSLRAVSADEGPVTRTYYEFLAEVDELLLAFIIAARKASPDALITLLTAIAEGDAGVPAENKIRWLFSGFNSESPSSPAKPKLLDAICDFVKSAARESANRPSSPNPATSVSTSASTTPATLETSVSAANSAAAGATLFLFAVAPVLREHGRAWLRSWTETRSCSPEEAFALALKIAGLFAEADAPADADEWRRCALAYKFDEDTLVAVLTAALNSSTDGYVFSALVKHIRPLSDAAAGSDAAAAAGAVGENGGQMGVVAEESLKGETRALVNIARTLASPEALRRPQLIDTLLADPSLPESISKSALRTKMLILLLSYRAHNTLAEAPADLERVPKLDVSELARDFGVSEVALLDAAAAAIAAGVLHARIDDENNSLTIHAGFVPEFTLEDLTALKERLAAWHKLASDIVEAHEQPADF